MPANREHPRRCSIGLGRRPCKSHRWLPGRYIVLVADSAFAAIEFLAAVRNHVV